MDYSPPGSSVHEIFQQEYWSGLPCPPPGYLPNAGIEPTSPELQVGSLPLSHMGSLSLSLSTYVYIYVYLSFTLSPR